jgi:adenylyltransferase/sulfurtransferase
MPVRILIPTALRPYAGESPSVEVEATTAGEALRALAGRYPDLARHLFGEDGRLRSFVNVYVGEEDIRALQGEATPLAEGAELAIVPSIAGGGDTATRDTDTVRLSRQEILRYSRHLILPEVGMEGQKKLKASSVLVIGTGGLGAPLGMYLAAAGVGRIGLVDFDTVEFSNLQRQVAFGTSDVGRPKLEAARERLQDINPDIAIETHETRLDKTNALDILSRYDVIVDGTDNFPTRYLVNDASALIGKPNVYGSIFRFEGQVSVFWAGRGPCYRCLYPEPPPPGLVPSCAEGGVLGVLPGIVGSIQAAEAIKILLGRGKSLVGRLLLFDALEMRFRELKLRRDPRCPLCGENPTIRELVDYEAFCGVRQTEPAGAEISPLDLKKRLESGEPLLLLDVRTPQEWEICRLEGAKLLPMNELAARMAELDSTKEIVAYCKVGLRSAQAAALLRAAGFNARNLQGGLEAWARDVDPELPRY